MVTNIHEHKRYYYTFFDNSLLYLLRAPVTTQIFPQPNVRFLQSALGRWHNVHVRAKPCVHRFNYS